MRLPQDLPAGGLILFICVWLYYETTKFDHDPLGMAQGMSATHMPRLVISVIAVLTVIMIVQAIVSRSSDNLKLPHWKIFATAIIMGLAAVLFVPAGVPLTFLVICIVLPLLWGARNVPGIILFALGLPAAIYLVFQVLLGLRLPAGPLGFLA